MKRNMRWLSFVLTMLMMSVLTLSVLAEEIQPTPTPPAEPVLTLEGYNGSLLTMEKGETKTLNLRVSGDEPFTYGAISVSHPGLLKVDYAALTLKVTAEFGSQETITVTLKGKVGEDPQEVSFRVKVNSKVTSASISQEDQIMEVGEKFTFKATYGPGDATDTTTVWKSSNPEIADIDAASGEVTAKKPGVTKISVTVGGMAAPVDKEVQVSGLIMEQPKGTMLVGKAMSIEYHVYGKAADELEEWTSSNNAVAGVSHGNVYAYTPGKTTITLKMGYYSASCEVIVEEDVASAILVDLAPGKLLQFSDILDELNERSKEKTGHDLDYISAISADPYEGVVYYGYKSPESPGMGVGNIDSFYKTPNSSQMGIKDLSFVPDKSFGGTTLISYVGYGEGVPFSGRIRVTVERSADVKYSGEAGKPVFFSAEDFNTACRVKTGQALRYVTFRLPAKAQGILYQRYNAAGQYMPPVTSGTKYHVFGSTLHLDDVVFVPAAGFSGTVNIPYTATDSSGNSFSGNIAITVSPGSGGTDSWVEGAVSYTTTGNAVTFAGEDFEQACEKANGKKLDYISFTLPAEAEGKLYSGYTSASKPGTAVTADAHNTVKDLSKISFVPKSGFAGTVTIPFTGLDEADKVFSGTVVIRVLSYDVQVEFTTASLPVNFDPELFRFSCVSALPKKLLSVEFAEMPSAYEGKILMNYKGFGSGTAAEEGTRYYYSGTPGIKQLTFVPKADYQGTVELPYVAYDIDGNSISGVAMIHVSRSYAKLEFSDLAAGSDVIPAVEFLKENGVIGGYSDGTFRPQAATSRAAYAAMVCRLFGFKAEVSDDPYPDVTKDSWCAETAAAAKKYGVIYGDKQGMFNPTASVTKQQAVVMLQRAMESAGKTVPAAPISILLQYRDCASVSSYAETAMANMIALGVVEGDYFGNLRPDKPITRAEMAQILYRLLVL